ncbi:hypothetical protein VCHA43P277_60195 [Vibrio chagasii]|nr:hypothetical protein VCHA34P126_10835 [Vibrio chagasii]CAH6947679.1 hypothetical protein VCHA50O407_120136 [Vibrio chagasii]CAH7045079.1 hypothetical protein VCHA36P161_60198 [Vibrio chagasii]CAH7058648.1 hypothetical protein VCHA37O173_70197 [Vibrio chagasii]CAH7068088.1 hypothetical protein VCHA29O39_70197 [Vibrio chagasii]
MLLSQYYPTKVCMLLAVHKQHGRMPPLILSLYKIVEPFHRYLAKSYRETYAIFQAWIKLIYC